MVVIYHAGIFGFSLPNRVHRFGWIGVDLFFVLSGYLIGGQLLASLARNRQIDLGRFYSRRALRILPPYFAVLALYFLLPSLREYSEISPLWKFILSLQNIGLHGGTAFSHAWSLAVEDQFYLLLPLVLLFVANSPRSAAWIVVFVMVAGLLLRGLLAWLHPGDSGVAFGAFQLWIYYPTWTRLDPLVCGVAVAAIERFRPGWWNTLTKTAKWLWLPGIALVVFALWLGEAGLSITVCVLQFPLIALGMSSLLICAVSPSLPISRWQIPGAAFVASIAYSIYLTHKLVIHFAIGLCGMLQISLNSLPALLLVEAAIYFAGAIFFFVVERPFLQLRDRIDCRNRTNAGGSSPDERVGQ